MIWVTAPVAAAASEREPEIRAEDLGYHEAALKVCPEVEVGNPKLRASLQKYKARYPKAYKEGWDAMIAKSKGEGFTFEKESIFKHACYNSANRLAEHDGWLKSREGVDWDGDFKKIRAREKAEEYLYDAELCERLGPKKAPRACSAIRR